MEKEEFKPIIECASKTMMRCLTIATECAIELVINEDVSAELRTKLRDLLALESTLKYDPLLTAYHSLTMLVNDCYDGDNLVAMQRKILDILKEEYDKMDVYDSLLVILEEN